jgi:hypothetical protein
MIRVIEVIPRDRIADGVDIGTSVARYSEQVAEVLADNWGQVDDVQLRVRIGQGTECWQSWIEVTGHEFDEADIEDGTLLDEYRWASAYVWARGQWAVMAEEEVRA